MGHVFCADSEKPAAMTEGSERQDGPRLIVVRALARRAKPGASPAAALTHRLPNLRAASKRL